MADSDDDLTPLTPTEKRCFRGHLIKASAGAAVGAVVLAVSQANAAATDYQNAFLVGAIAGSVTMFWVLFQLHMAFRVQGQKWLVPLLSVTTLGLAVMFLRVETLSGELVPQFRWRFANVRVPDVQLLPPAESSVEPIESPVESIESPDEPIKPIDPSVAAAPTPAASWSQFLGDNRDGAAATREFDIPESADEIKTVWDIGIGGGWASFAVADGLAVTLEQRDDRECVTAYRIDDGQLVWLTDHVASHFQALGQGGPRSTPAIVGDRVYAQGATGKLWCLDLATGDEIWTHDLLTLAGWTQDESETAITWGRSGSPLIVDGLCVVPIGGPDGPRVGDDAPMRSLIALDAATGAVTWQAGADQISYASPQVMTLDGVRQIVSVNEQTITGHVIASGQTLWSFDWYGQSNSGANCAAAIPAGDDQFLIGKGYGGGSALVRVALDDTDDDSNPSWTAQSVWTSDRVLKTKFNHVVVRSGVAYGLSNGALQAVEIESGTRLWEQSRRGRFGQGQVVLVGDVLVVQAETGEVALVRASPDGYDEIVRIDALHHKTWNIPAIAGKLILVRNDRQAKALRLP